MGKSSGGKKGQRETIMPTISVIVAAYNVENYIGRCLRSLELQTFKDFEVIAVDDGAKDNTGNICDSFSEKDKRFITVHKENGGLSDARNKGIESSSGRYITFIDGDDYVHPGYLNTLYRMITKREDINISMLPAQTLWDDEIPEMVFTERPHILSNRQAMRMMLLRDGITHSSWGKLFEKNLWDGIKFPVGYEYEDYATTYRVFEKAKYVSYTDSRMYYYIQRSDSIMAKPCSLQTLTVLDIADSQTGFISAVAPELRKDAVSLKLAIYMKNMHEILKTGYDAFPEYQKRIKREVWKNSWALLTNRRAPVKDKVKAISLMTSKRLFFALYNRYNGSVKN